MRGSAVKMLTALYGRRPTHKLKANFNSMSHQGKGVLRGQFERAKLHREQMLGHKETL